jgi:oligoendopeptidase F
MADNNVLPKRSEIDAKYKWKLEDIYASDAKWEQDFEKVRRMAGEITKYKGTFAGDINKLVQCLKFNEEMLSLNDKLFAYARMRRDEDNAEPRYQALTDRAMTLSTEVYAAVSFIVPEIISIDEELLKKSIDEIEGLSVYRQYIYEIIRQKKTHFVGKGGRAAGSFSRNGKCSFRHIYYV